MAFNGLGLHGGDSGARRLQEFAVDSGVLKIDGTDKNDRIVISESAGNLLKIVSVLNGVRKTETVSKAGLNSIQVVGKKGDDFILNKTSLRSTLLGGKGNDRLVGGTKNDVMLGGEGDDFLVGGTGNDVLRGEEGNDILSGSDGNDRLYGSAGRDVMSGGSGNDRIWGDAGNDVLNGNDGIDRILGGSGDDTALGGKGNDQISGEAGDDVIRGNEGNDRLMGGDGNDGMDGGDGNDSIFGDAGNDEINGRKGNDRIDGDAGLDLIYGDEGLDRINGGDGDDLLLGDDGNDVINGNAGTDSVIGQAGDDRLDGDSATSFDTDGDAVLGGLGADQVIGTYGYDSLAGGNQAGDRERTRFLISSTADTNDGNFAAGELTFREAVALANADDILSFVAIAANSGVVIQTTGGTYALAANVTIQGASDRTRVVFDGTNNGGNRLFSVAGGNTVAFRDLTIRNSTAGIGNGGAILANGHAILDNVIGTGNSAANGGLVYVNGAAAMLTVRDSLLHDNTSTAAGGAIFNSLGTTVISTSTLESNTAATSGGGVENSGTLRVSASTFYDNLAATGGAIGAAVVAAVSSLSVVNSTLSGNRSATGGAAIDTNATATTQVTHSTIVLNQSTGAVGGGLVLAGATKIDNSIVFGNRANNVLTDFGAVVGLDEANSFNNLIGTASGSTFVNATQGNLVGVTDAGLDLTLADNGGPTKTHKLLAGSVAINAGNDAKSVDSSAVTLTVDQRLKNRKIGSAVDIGAFEFSV